MKRREESDRRSRTGGSRGKKCKCTGRGLGLDFLSALLLERFLTAAGLQLLLR